MWRTVINQTRLFSSLVKSPSNSTAVKSRWDGNKLIECEWADQHRIKVHAWWLQDNDQRWIDSPSGQKLRSSGDLEVDVTVKEVTNDGKDLKVVWSNGTKSEYDLKWLREYAPPATALQGSAKKPTLWTASELEKQLPEVKYSEVISDDFALWKMLNNLHLYGVCFVRGVPTQNVDESAKLIHRFGYIRETFYGRLWDVKSVKDALNIAYTSLELKHHMDLEYFETPPGLQLLHCLANTVVGGNSTFLDSFKAAELLKQESLDHYNTLARVPVTFHYRRGSRHMRYTKKTIEEDGFNEYLRVNYAPPFQGPLDIPVQDIERFYLAFKAFEKILARPTLTYITRAEPGDLAIFNNRRILHGRTQFDPRTGERHLRGSYMDLDDFRNAWRVLSEKFQS